MLTFFYSPVRVTQSEPTHNNKLISAVLKQETQFCISGKSAQTLEQTKEFAEPPC